MPRILLLLVLAIATVLELLLVGGTFFAPAFTPANFGVKYGLDTAFLGCITGWFCCL